MTGLVDRAHGIRRLAAALARDGGGATVVCAGLDHFRAVNDALGYAGGDEVLARVGAAVAEVAGSAGVVARQAGDELLVIVEGPMAADAVGAAVATAIGRPMVVGGVELRVGASLGVAAFPEDGPGADAEALVERATAAMYEAKAAGGRQVRRAGPAGDRAAALERLALSGSLPRAIERDELVLHWQPIVDLGTREIMGLEALVRWEHPERGLLAPGAFIPFAEATGLVTEVDAWVASAVTAQRHAWHREGLDPYVGFNLSPQAAQRPEAIDRLVGRLRAGGLDVDHVTVELTESEALCDDGGLGTFVGDLQRAGITVGLDDFGQSHSSLNRLREIPVRWIKLDRAFLTHVPDDPAATRVLRAVLDFVGTLGFDCIVEGVERDDQLTLLQTWGVTAAQGFLLGRPVPAAELLDRLHRSPPSRLAVRAASPAAS